MSYRFMRVIVLFDLPTYTMEDMRAYRSFRKYLISNGFIMMQESVYCKLVLNTTVANSVMTGVRKNAPPKGLVQMLMVTEKQYLNIEFVVGEHSSEVVNTDKRITIL